MMRIFNVTMPLSCRQFVDDGLSSKFRLTE